MQEGLELLSCHLNGEYPECKERASRVSQAVLNTATSSRTHGASDKKGEAGKGKYAQAQLLFLVDPHTCAQEGLRH